MSIKSELYKYVKSIVKGGEYIDLLGNSETFLQIEGVKHFNFWNNNIVHGGQSDSFPLTAVFFELTNTNKERIHHSIPETNSRQTQRDKVEFTLHIVTGKMHTEAKENNWIDALDIAETIYLKLLNKTKPGIQNITKVSEGFDNDSQQLIDYRLNFECILINEGDGMLVNRNDVNVNPTAPVSFGLSIQQF